MLRVRLVKDPPGEWPSFHAADPRATLFLHPRWTEALAAAYPAFRPRWFVAEDAGRISGILPFMEYVRFGLSQVLSLPFGTHGGPLIAPDADGRAVAAALIAAFRRRAGGIRVVRFEMSVFDPGPALRAGVADALGDALEERGTHVVDLRPGFEALWSRHYDRNTRNCVRMAERAGVTVEVERGPDALDLLARLHAGQSGAWEGVRPHPREALAAVIDVLGEEARIHVARREGRPLMASLVLDHPPREAHPWVSGSSPEARPVRAAHLLYDRALRAACERGREMWNFGGSAGNPGVEYFKSSFGARPVPVLRGYRTARWFRGLRGAR